MAEKARCKGVGHLSSQKEARVRGYQWRGGCRWSDR